MAGIKITGFDTDKLMRDIQKNIEKDLKMNPEKILDYHAGGVIEAECSKCGNTRLKILTKGRAECTKCGCVTKVNLVIKYK